MAALLVASAAIAMANPAIDARATAPGTTLTDETEAPVSTRPATLDRPSLAGPAHAAGSAANQTPLTRAASKRRVDEMSPMAWLAHYGPVTVGPNE
jgi:hypothetical protein